jgi:hypothetical protein
MNQFPQAPEYTNRAVSIFSKILRSSFTLIHKVSKICGDIRSKGAPQMEKIFNHKSFDYFGSRVNL